jgi:DNA polymerase/3'-5' exonuclease PolX
MPDGSIVFPESEQHIFELAGLEYVAPENRN